MIENEYSVTLVGNLFNITTVVYHESEDEDDITARAVGNLDQQGLSVSGLYQEVIIEKTGELH